MAADERLSRDRRVRKRQDFLRIQASRRKYRSEHLLVAVSTPREAAAPRSNAPRLAGADSSIETKPAGSRIGITVTRKVDKRAARRNRIMRWVREFFRKQRSYFREQVDMVVIALDGAAELDYQQLTFELRGLMRRAGILADRKA